MAFWDDSNHDALALGLRLLHIEVEEGTVRLTVAAWMLVLIDVLQQMAWVCAALSSSPFPERLAEARTQVCRPD